MVFPSRCVVCLVVACAFIVSSEKVHAKGLVQGAYDQCVKSYNKKFSKLSGAKAMVVGWNGSDNGWRANCYWVWNSSNQDKAIERAISDCRKAGWSKCAVFATGSGLAAWSKRVSDNGGRDPDAGRSNGSSADAVIGSFLQGVINGANAVNRAGGSWNNGSQPRRATPSQNPPCVDNYGGQSCAVK